MPLSIFTFVVLSMLAPGPLRSLAVSLSATSATVASAPGNGPVVYVCPMDPDVVSATAGKCPKCGMKLVARPGAAGS